MLSAGRRSAALPVRLILAIALGAGFVASAASQQPLPASPPRPTLASPPMKDAVHKFWDKRNVWLFAGVGASRTFDYFSTLNMRRRGRDEILLTNDVVDNHPAFAAIEAAGTGVSIGAAYLFHHYGHHKLERWISLIHFGAAATGGIRNYCLKSAPTPAPLSP
jgi:hypothetical protein